MHQNKVKRLQSLELCDFIWAPNCIGFVNFAVQTQDLALRNQMPNVKQV
jgi:hypothetical protein